MFDLPTTRALRERPQVDATLRRLCGWERIDGVPSEATFSRAFAEFAESDLPTRLHEALERAHLEGHVVGHIARDSTAIPVRERRQRKADQEPERAAADADRPRGPFAPEPAEVGPEQGETQPGREQERLGEARGSGQPPSWRGPGRAVWSGSVR